LRHTYFEIRGLGIEFIAVANEEPENHREIRERLDLPFMLLSDPDAEVARAYGAFHENEPRGRSIARPGLFLIDSAANGAIVRWEHVGPTTRHRVPPSRIVEELLKFLGRKQQIVSVHVPSETELLRVIGAYQEPALGHFRTPDELQSGVLVEREFTQQNAMASYSEVHRLADEGWSLVTVVPEFEGERSTGQRYVFERKLE
jgi:hypothetical protein